MPAEGTRRRRSVTTGPVRITLLFLALPIFAEQILNTFVGMFDTYLAGQISASATSAIGLAAYVGWLTSMIVMLVGTGTTALVSRNEGGGDHAEANRFANQSMTLAAILGVLLLGLFYTLAPWFARYCRMTGETYDYAVTYLRIDAVGHMLMSLTLVGSAAFRGVGNMRTPMFIFGIINTVNVITSCVLVYGLGPFPAMGVTGIVVGTVTAKTLGAILMVTVLLRGRAGLKLRYHQLPLVPARVWRLLRIGIPAAGDGAFMWSGHFVFLAIISRLADPPWGQVYFAAHIVAVRVEALTYLPAFAWAAASATMIGQALGARNPIRAKRVGHEAVLQCGMLSVMITALYYFGAAFIYDKMSLDPLVRAAGVRPFQILALLQPCLTVSIIYIGSLRGAGDTRFPLLITLFGIMIRIPTGYYFGIVLGWGLIGAWMGMFGDIIWRAMSATLRYVGGRWLTTSV